MAELNKAIIGAVDELLTMFGLEYEILEETIEEKLKSSEEVNVILGLAGEIHGNIVLGATKNTVIKIVSGMMGGMEITEVDEIVISGISEFTNMLGGTTITKLQTENFVDITPPTVITSEGNTIIINQLKAHNLIFSIGGEKLIISYCIKE